MARVLVIAAAAALMGGCTLTGLSPVTTQAINAGSDLTTAIVQDLED
jgi:hypothetical protein